MQFLKEKFLISIRISVLRVNSMLQWPITIPGGISLQYCQRIVSKHLVYLPHDDVIKWKHFPRYWPFVRGIHRSQVNSLHKGQSRGALMFAVICTWINGWVNNREAGDLRRHHNHYDVIVMFIASDPLTCCVTLGIWSHDKVPWIRSVWMTDKIDEAFLSIWSEIKRHTTSHRLNGIESS